jgi:hypothetical protein
LEDTPVVVFATARVIFTGAFNAFNVEIGVPNVKKRWTSTSIVEARAMETVSKFVEGSSNVTNVETRTSNI